MHLITLIGPPAVGKYTVGKLLREKTGYKLFHNHLTVDVALSLFDYGTHEFFPLMADLRLRYFEFASRSSILGLIFTCAFAFPDAEDFADKMVKIVERNGGKCDFVRLNCSLEELKKRVGNIDRQDFGKITELTNLISAINNFNLFQVLPNKDSFEIDTSELNPSETCDNIIANLNINSLE